VVDVAQTRASFPQAIFDGMTRKAFVEFLAREALLLRRGHDVAILDQRGGAVVVERGDTEEPHDRYRRFRPIMT
jgi:hypothetical protein